MANITASLTPTPPSGASDRIQDETLRNGEVRIYDIKWENITENDTVLPQIIDPKLIDIAIHIYGTFGGGNVAIQGSNDGVVYSNLNNGKGESVDVGANSFVVGGLDIVPLYVKPGIFGSANSNVSVSMLTRY